MRRFFILLSSALLLAALFATYAGVARIYASTAQPQLPDVNCSNNDCNGLDPVRTGCASDAFTVSTVSFRTGSIQLRFSPTCGTNWGRVRSAVGNTQLWVSIRRINDGRFYFRVRSDASLSWSPMVFARSVTAQACGSADHFENCTGAF